MRLIIIAIVGALLCGCSGAEYRHASGATWGTTYSITYKSPHDLSDSIVKVMRQVDLSLSPFEKESLVSKANRNQPVKADSMLADVMRLSQRVCAISGGAFDPTVAPLINLWGFGYRDGADFSPSQEEIDSALKHVGILECGISADGYVYKKTPKTEFNFSAIAKGYGVDAIAGMLRRNGCTDYMVEVGGEIALSGRNPKSENWRIQVDAPVIDSTRFAHRRLTVLEITDRCMATSGNYRNFRMIGDSIVGHTIHPSTGRPMRTATLSVTVVAPSTALADALATAAMAMPADKAKEMLEALPDVEALIVSTSPGSDSGYAISAIPADGEVSDGVSRAAVQAKETRSW